MGIRGGGRGVHGGVVVTGGYKQGERSQLPPPSANFRNWLDKKSRMGRAGFTAGLVSG